MVEELMIKRLYRAIELMTRVFFVYQWTRLILNNFSDPSYVACLPFHLSYHASVKPQPIRSKAGEEAQGSKLRTSFENAICSRDGSMY